MVPGFFRSHLFVGAVAPAGEHMACDLMLPCMFPHTLEGAVGYCVGRLEPAPGPKQFPLPYSHPLQNLAQKGSRARVLCCREDLGRCPRLNDLARVHEQNAIGYLTGKAHLVGHNDHGHAFFC